MKRKKKVHKSIDFMERVTCSGKISGNVGIFHSSVLCHSLVFDTLEITAVLLFKMSRLHFPKQSPSSEKRSSDFIVGDFV